MTVISDSRIAQVAYQDLWRMHLDETASDRKHPAWIARGQRARSRSISMSSLRFSIPDGVNAMMLLSPGP
ncbi:MAG: hypothetical protein ACU0BZ_09920 [Paracoccus sp. (in: a-proteobacteria)]|jgi:hypothetical protein|uniref:hypothetical protein n=1 Tax=Paracoccus sp. TaxID=267 RepID=UPI0025CBB015|nr:hypothetical protein [Paracoccus sp. (in: a-proteobacteria)]|tara:strand:- start:146 stop:355 length:210 start_codon:yes stop_codon:yes gene_type:complete